MRPITAFVLFTTLALGVTEDTTTQNLYDDKINTIESKPSARLDPYIRKALLKALSDLEESQTIIDTESTDGSLTDSTYTDDFVTQTNQDNIKIHSFVVNGQEAFTNRTNSSPLVVDKNISILSTTVGNVESHLPATLPTQDPFQEIFQTKETGINLQQVRSIQATPSSKSNDKDIHKFKNFKPFRTSTSTTSTTTTTTTTTTPKPTHNADGENIEDVDKKDVHVYQAPLVAAFTVQQDGHGIPKKVIPIFQQTNNNQELKLASTNIISNSISKAPNDFLALQYNLQKELEDKQRVLEEQLRLLQLHQRQQEELLRHQQYLLQQKESHRQQQLYLEQEQLKKLIYEQQKGTNVLQSNLVNKQVPQSQISSNGLLPSNSQVSIQQSVALDQTNLAAIQQQLPNREAVDFLLHLRNQQRGQFPLQSDHLPLGIDNFLRPKPTPTFSQGPLINHISGLDELPQRHSNRVFRQESGVGNFGNSNNNLNRFNSFGPINTNRFLPSRPNHFNSNIELSHLLAQRGIDGRANEDLNIVSKVLSLNHGIPQNNVSNRLPFDFRRPVRATL